MINIHVMSQLTKMDKDCESSSDLVGIWELESSENWEDYLKALGVSFMHRKLIANIVPKVEICRTGNRWESKTYTPLKNTHKIYFDGEEFEETTLDGRVSKSVVKSDGPNRLVHEQRHPQTNKIVTVITREVIKDKLVQTFVIGNIKCVRIFRRAGVDNFSLANTIL